MSDDGGIWSVYLLHCILKEAVVLWAPRERVHGIFVSLCTENDPDGENSGYFRLNIHEKLPTEQIARDVAARYHDCDAKVLCVRFVWEVEPFGDGIIPGRHGIAVTCVTEDGKESGVHFFAPSAQVARCVDLSHGRPTLCNRDESLAIAYRLIETGKRKNGDTPDPSVDNWNLWKFTEQKYGIRNRPHTDLYEVPPPPGTRRSATYEALHMLFGQVASVIPDLVAAAQNAAGPILVDCELSPTAVLGPVESLVYNALGRNVRLELMGDSAVRIHRGGVDTHWHCRDYLTGYRLDEPAGVGEVRLQQFAAQHTVSVPGKPEHQWGVAVGRGDCVYLKKAKLDGIGWYLFVPMAGRHWLAIAAADSASGPWAGIMTCGKKIANVEAEEEGESEKEADRLVTAARRLRLAWALSRWCWESVLVDDATLLLTTVGSGATTEWIICDKGVVRRMQCGHLATVPLGPPGGAFVAIVAEADGKLRFSQWGVCGPFGGTESARQEAIAAIAEVVSAEL